MSETANRDPDTARWTHELAARLAPDVLQEFAAKHAATNKAAIDQAREILEKLLKTTAFQDFIQQNRTFTEDLLKRPMSLDVFADSLEKRIKEVANAYATGSSSEEAEADEILARLDQRLPKLEARIDNLMRHYGLAG